MEWLKRKIEVNTLNKFYQDYAPIVRKDEVNLTQCYCVWQYKDEPLLHFYSIKDFITNYTEIISFAPITDFYLYQPKYSKST